MHVTEQQQQQQQQQQQDRAVVSFRNWIMFPGTQSVIL